MTVAKPAHMPKVATIPPHVAFLPSLARWFYSHFSGQDVSQAMILLPTRRAGRAFRQALFDLLPAEQASLMLPRILAIGDLENEPLIQHLLLANEASASAYMALPTAISRAERRVRMQRLVSRIYPDALPAHSLALADALLELMDECQTARLPTKLLEQIMPEAMAAHWQVLLPHLQLIIEAWPEILAQEGKTDPITRRNAVLNLLTQNLTDTPYPFPIIAAGSTGSQPATADLLREIARQPQGYVVLPALDMESDEELWEVMEEGHPQYPLKALLSHMQLPRNGVDIISQETSQQSLFWQQVLAPEKGLENWRKQPYPKPENVHVLDCANDALEAQTITLLIREILEMPEKTVALITPSQSLVAQVLAQLNRYNVPLQSSAGTPLRDTPAGVFLRLVIEWMSAPTQPLKMLALWQHPLAHMNASRIECLAAAREFEREQCHGVVMDKSWEAYFSRSSVAVAPYLKILRNLHISTRDEDRANISAELVLKQCLHAAESLSTDAAGTVHLWHTHEAQSLQSWAEEWLQASRLMEPVSLAHMPPLIESMLAGCVVRHVYQSHPQISILSPMEARLLHFDRVILAGLNENIWPECSNSGPWISRAMRRQAGMTSLEEHISQQALGFYHQACSDEVFCTYSHKVAGSPALPSRWLERLKAYLHASGSDALTQHPASAWAAQLHHVEHVQEMPPPMPELHGRAWPQLSLSATSIEKLISNPYAIYAAKILGLKPLDPLDAPLSARESGTYIHEVLEQWAAEAHAYTGFNEAFEQLWPMAKHTLDALPLPPSTRAFWEPQWKQMLVHFLLWDMAAQPYERVVSEARGEMELAGWNVHATPDRVDRLPDGSLRVVDYKTKRAIVSRDIAEGRLLQLPITALIAREGGFAGIARNTPSSELEYWPLKATRPVRLEGKKTDGLDVDTYVQHVHDGLAQLLTWYTSSEARFPYDPYENLDNPYENDMPHLARVKEWR